MTPKQHFDNGKSIKRWCTRMVQNSYISHVRIFSRKKCIVPLTRLLDDFAASAFAEQSLIKCCSSSYWIAKKLTFVAFFYTENNYCLLRVYKHHYLLIYYTKNRSVSVNRGPRGTHALFMRVPHTIQVGPTWDPRTIQRDPRGTHALFRRDPRGAHGSIKWAFLS